MWSLSFTFYQWNPVCISIVSYAHQMLGPSHPLWFDRPNNTWRAVQVMKLLVLQYAPTSKYFIFNPSSWVAYSRNPSALPLMRPCFIPIKIDKIVVLYILIYVSGSKREDNTNDFIASKSWCYSLLLPFSSFVPSFLSSFLPSFTSSFPSFVLPSCLPPVFLSSFLPACLPVFLPFRFFPFLPSG